MVIFNGKLLNDQRLIQPAGSNPRPLGARPRLSSQRLPTAWRCTMPPRSVLARAAVGFGPTKGGQDPPNMWNTIPVGSMYAIYGNIYHQYTPNVSIYALYTIHGSYGIDFINYCVSIWISARTQADEANRDRVVLQLAHSP